MPVLAWSPGCLKHDFETARLLRVVFVSVVNAASAFFDFALAFPSLARQFIWIVFAAIGVPGIVFVPAVVRITCPRLFLASGKGAL